MNKFLYIFKIGDTDRLATDDDLLNFEQEFNKVYKQSEGEDMVLVCHHAVNVIVVPKPDLSLDSVVVE